jgi:hypothetical protein
VFAAWALAWVVDAAFGGLALVGFWPDLAGFLDGDLGWVCESG